MGIWWCLWSLNEVAQGREGVELPRPSLRWVLDVVAAVRADAESIQKDAERMEEDALRRRLTGG